MGAARERRGRRSVAAVALASGLAFGLGGCALPLSLDIDGGRDVVGYGPVLTESFDVPRFDAVEASGAVSIVVRRTGGRHVALTAQESLLPYLEAEVRGGVLYVGVVPGVSVRSHEPIRILVESGRLEDVRGSGAVDLDVDVGRVDVFYARLSGASRLAVRGDAEVQDVGLSGASRYHAPDLRSLDVFVDASGASDALVRARDYLEVDASGASRIRFVGRPEVRARVSGGATVSGY